MSDNPQGLTAEEIERLEMRLAFKTVSIEVRSCDLRALIAAAKENARLASELSKAHADMDATMQGWDSLCEHSDRADDALTAANARIAELEEALRPFAEEAELWTSKASDGEAPQISAIDDVYEHNAAFSVGDLRRAARLLPAPEHMERK